MLTESYDENGDLICPYTSEICLYFVNLFPDEEPEFCGESCMLHYSKQR